MALVGLARQAARERNSHNILLVERPSFWRRVLIPIVSAYADQRTGIFCERLLHWERHIFGVST
jgi:hypothetical protein